MKNEKIVQIDISKKMTLLCISLAVIFWVISIILWKQQLFDQSFIIFHNSIYQNNFAHSIFNFFTNFGLPLITSIYIFNLLISKRYPDLVNVYKLYLLFIFSFAFAGIGGDILKELINRARPAASLAGQIIRTHISDSPSLPSGHSTKSIALVLPYIIFASNKPKINKLLKVILLIVALMVCYSRIALQAHYLSDVLAGIGTAFIFLPISVTFANHLYRRKNIDYTELNKFIKKMGFILILLTLIFCFM